MKEGQEIVMAFSDFTARLSRKVKFRYYPPDEIKDYLRLLADQEKSEENSEGEKNSASADA
jgi:hypothetical protein